MRKETVERFMGENFQVKGSAVGELACKDGSGCARGRGVAFVAFGVLRIGGIGFRGRMESKTCNRAAIGKKSEMGARLHG